ncbi:MAG: hypothetical protein IH598_04510 [Bacteroidales bacterium]|nr:hypothetical protein [Bacteroidales bacterium]
MKIRNMLFKVLSFLFFLVLTTTLTAQDPPPPPGGHGLEGNQTPPGGGTPVGSGLVILLTLGAAYGGKKVYEMRKRA